MVPRATFQPTAFQQETQAQIDELDKLLPSDAFTADVRQSLYRYALIRNSWGTTNIDAGPIELTRPKERIEQDLSELLAWYNKTRGDLPLVVRVAIFFHEFQRIHPFGDGNGRVGRLAALMLLSAGGLEAVRYAPVDDAINEDRNEYY